MRRLIIGSGMKMYSNLQHCLGWFRRVGSAVGDDGGVDVFVLPSFPFLYYAKVVLQGTGVRYGAQNMHWEPKGAFTGEVSAQMLVDLGCTYVELGHSERRALFNETDETVNKKARLALQVGLIPIICIGEDRFTKESGGTDEFLGTQIQGAFKDMNPDEAARVVLAYEPVWAIGVDKPAESSYIAEKHSFIRSELSRMFGAETADSTRIMYGGSVILDQSREILEIPDVDGLFIGRAALVPDNFLKIVDVAVSLSAHKR